MTVAATVIAVVVAAASAVAACIFMVAVAIVTAVAACIFMVAGAATVTTAAAAPQQNSLLSHPHRACPTPIALQSIHTT